MLHKQRSSSSEKEDSFVRNSSFLSRDIEAKARLGKDSPPKSGSPPKVVFSPKKEPSLPKNSSPPKNRSPPKQVPNPSATSSFRIKRADTPDENSVVARASKIEAACSPPNKEVTSPPASASFKINRSNSREGPPKVPKRENSLIKDKEAPKTEQPAAVVEKQTSIENKINPTEVKKNNSIEVPSKEDIGDQSPQQEESNGVGDKIKKFEKAAEDAGGASGKLSRPGSVRGRSRTERLGSDSKEDFPPPATPFKDNVHFELPAPEKESNPERPQQHGIMKNNSAPRWPRGESHEDKVIQKPEPQKIIKPEFKPMPSPVDVTIRSPSLGTKLPDQFPSHGTAFRNVASPDRARNLHKFNEDVNTQNNVKACNKLKKDPKSFVSKGSSYFTRGSEEIWLVKKKDIEEIEERVLDSFRRAGGNICMRSESMRPASDSGQGASFSHATMGRNKRQMYARSESCDPAWGARAHTLKRQTSVACTCGHDKKVRAKSVGPDPAPSPAPAPPATPRPRSRSHGDDNQTHVLDKYETLV